MNEPRSDQNKYRKPCKWCGKYVEVGKGMYYHSLDATVHKIHCLDQFKVRNLWVDQSVILNAMEKLGITDPEKIKFWMKGLPK